MMIFGYRLIHDSEFTKALEQVAQARADVEVQRKLVAEYQHQVKTLREFHQQEKLKDIIDINIGDPSPDKPEARKMYIGRVAGFYRDILEGKCKQMISNFHRLLEEETNDRETDLYLKIGIFICRDLMKWGESAIGEQIAYQTEPPPSPAEIKEELITQTKL